MRLLDAFASTAPQWPLIDAGPAYGNSVRVPGVHPRFYDRHLWLPVAAFVLSTALLMGMHGDLWLADRLYAMEGSAWSLQAGYLTQDLLHATGRQASKDLWFTLAAMVVLSLLMPRARRWRRPLLYLLLATALSTVVVGLLKRWTNVDCPWDLLRYGGGKAYYGLFAARPAALPQAHCFPAGHASAGYAWVALYFFFRSERPRWRWWGLAFALGLGAAFGLAQQLRGAHFLSHDIWALMICWLVALALYRPMLGCAERSAVRTAP